MLGAGTILGYINYLANIKSRKNVIGLLAIAENMPGKFASRPGDVVKSYSGKTKSNDALGQKEPMGQCGKSRFCDTAYNRNESNKQRKNIGWCG